MNKEIFSQFIKNNIYRLILTSIVVMGILGFIACSIIYSYFSTQLEESKKESYKIVMEMTDQIQSLEDSLTVKQAIKDYKNKLDYIWPIHIKDWIPGPSALSSPFGERDDRECGGLSDGFHEGLDLWGVNHTGPTWLARIVAVSDGWVEHWLSDPINGEYYILHHDDGNESEYHHLSKGYIKDGEHVKQGEVLGRMGNTGISTGPHLHFQLEIKGELVNPLVYIDVPEEKDETKTE